MVNNNIVKLVVVILIPIGIYFGKGYLQEFLSDNEAMVVDLTPVENIDKVVNESSTKVDILKNYNATNIDYNVFAGVDANKLRKYFIDKAAVAPAAPTNQPVAIVRPPRTLVKAPVYAIDFVFVGEAEKYISLGNLLLEIGDKTPRGEVIKNIETNRVQLQGKWGLRWVPVNY